MGDGVQSVNVMGVGCINRDEAKFEALYTKEVNFLAKQGGGYHSNYPRQGGNQGWNRDEGWKDRDREWRDCNPTCKEKVGENDRYTPPHERQRPKDSEGGRSEDMLSRNLKKVEGSDKTLKEMKEDVSTLSQMVTSHFISIKQLETQMVVKPTARELGAVAWPKGLYSHEAKSPSQTPSQTVVHTTGREGGREPLGNNLPRLGSIGPLA
uniref:Integrase core domain containing protein n=1 Tax=Solanum tuberosum TaxID=4113 RepID=M1DH82_SOLTU